MLLFLSTGDSFVQMLIALAAFIVVLVLAVVVTKWLGKYQQGNLVNKNIKVIETFKVTNNKYIQIIQAGTKYVVIAVCKDTITKLAELTEEEILEWPNDDDPLVGGFQVDFNQYFDKVKERIKKK